MNDSELFLPPKIDASKSLLKNQAYNIIKNAILNNYLKPDQIYSQEFLSHSLGISRTPVREALLQLQLEGVVHIYRGRGVQIITMTHGDLRDILEMSDPIECRICQLSASRITAGMVKELGEVFERQRKEAKRQHIEEFIQEDKNFHMTMASGTNNKKFVECIEYIHEQVLRSGMFVVYNAEGMEKIVEEHSAIFNAIKKRSPQESLAAMRIHVDGVFSRAMSNMNKLE